MAYLRLPERLRDELKKPIGRLAKDAREFDIRPEDVVITIGDRVTADVLALGILPKVCAYDGRIERRQVPVSEKIAAFAAEKIGLKNPPGDLNEEAFLAVKKALKNEKRVKIEVDGEEDLIAVAALDAAPLGAVVLYGQPGEGVVYVRVDKKIKKRIKEIIEEMRNENRSN